MVLGAADVPVEQDEAGSVQRVVRQYAGQVSYCYEAQLKSDPTLQGRVEVAFTVHDGRVTSASVSENTTGSDALGKCIVNKVGKWRFPEEIEGDIVYPFVLSPVAGPSWKLAPGSGGGPLSAKQRRRVESCHQDALERNPGLQGELQLTTTDGDATVGHNDTGDAELAACLVDRVPWPGSGVAIRRFAFAQDQMSPDR